MLTKILNLTVSWKCELLAKLQKEKRNFTEGMVDVILIHVYANKDIIFQHNSTNSGEELQKSIWYKLTMVKRTRFDMNMKGEKISKLCPGYHGHQVHHAGKFVVFSLSFSQLLARNISHLMLWLHLTLHLPAGRKPFDSFSNYRKTVITYRLTW